VLSALLIAQLALATAPAGVRPVVAPSSAADDWHAWLAKQGRPTSDLACEVEWPGYASVCFRVYEPADGPKRVRRWVTTADLTRWKLTIDGLRTDVAAAAAKEVALLAQVKPVVDLPATYLEIVDGEGWAAAGLLAPDALAARLGGPPIAVAVPAETVLLAWKPGDDKIDLAMAVGVHELFTGQADPVTEVIHAWDGAKWSAYAVATPHVAAPGP
jgi:hypothetical protein